MLYFLEGDLNVLYMIKSDLEFYRGRTLPRGQFHRAAKQRKFAYQKYLLRRFSWLPAKFACKINVLWLVVCFKMLSKNIC